MTDPVEVERLLREQAQRHAATAERQAGYSAARYPEHAAVRENRLRRDRAFAELFARGIDPGHPRRFRGRIDLTVMCKPRGHELANVYPTTIGQVFVPTVAEQPLRQQQPGSARRRQMDEALRPLIAAGFGTTQQPGMERDPWVEVVDDDPDDEASVFIRGAGLVDRERWKKPEYDDAGHSLLCRCGTRGLWVRQMEEALDSRTRRIFV